MRAPPAILPMPPTTDVSRWGGLTRLVKWVLALPLFVKLLGANAMVVLVALTAGRAAGLQTSIALAAAALAAAIGLNMLLVRLALLPLDELERVAHQVISGEFQARVSVLPTADAQVVRLARAINTLLSTAAQQKAQLQQLMRESLRARERERAELASHLRDATAQQLAALTMQLAAAKATVAGTASAPMVDSAYEIASGMADDVRRVADAVYPGLLGRFGLYTAIEGLRGRLSEVPGLAVEIDTSSGRSSLPLTVTMALYGVAEEAVRNVEQHAHAKNVKIVLREVHGEMELRIDDDGVGFQVAVLEQLHDGIGVFRARELLAYAGGTLVIRSTIGKGTTVIATAPAASTVP